MEIAKFNLGPEIAGEVSVADGKVNVKLTRASASGSESFEMSESIKYFIDKEKDKLPSWLQDAVNAGEALIP